jgi:acyl carrier protein
MFDADQTLIDIQVVICEFVAREKKACADDIDIAMPFTELGLDSMSAVTISGALETALDVDLDPTLLWDYPTIIDLSCHLAELVTPGAARAARIAAEPA